MRKPYIRRGHQIFEAKAKRRTHFSYINWRQTQKKGAKQAHDVGRYFFDQVSGL